MSDTPSPKDASPGIAMPPASLSRRILKGCGIGLIFLVVAAVGLYDPPKRDDYPALVRRQLEALEAESDRVDLLFIGSSYTGYHVQREAFVESASTRGLSLHPFVLDLPGMQSFEADAMLDEALKIPMPRLRWVAMEYGDWRAESMVAQFDTQRGVWWQRPGRTLQFARSAFAEAADEGDRDDAIRPIARVLVYLGLNYSRIGVQSAETPYKDPAEALAAGVRGPRESDSFLLHPELIPGYEKAVRKQRERLQENGGWRTPEDGRFEAFAANAFSRQIERIRSAGAEPVYIVPPSLIKRSVRPDAAVLDFDNPEKFPELFRVQNREDRGHLTEATSEGYSRMLGEAFADAMTSGSFLPLSSPAH